MFPVTITLHSHEQLSRVLAVMSTEPVPKSAPASAASGPATAKESAVPTKTAKESAPAAVSAEDKSPVSTAAESKKSKGESAPAAAQSAEQAPAAITGTTDVSFATVRELVLKLAQAHRDGIKAINARHHIPKLSALLHDENDYTSVNDQPKLNAVYADLLALGA